IAHLIRKAWERVLDITGTEVEHISLPIKSELFEWMLRHSEPLQIALLDYAGHVHNRPSDARLQIIAKQQWLQQPKVKTQPAEGIVVYTDAGRGTKEAVCTWKEKSGWKAHVLDRQESDSLQTLELAAVMWALTRRRKEKLNIVSELHVCCWSSITNRRCFNQTTQR
ncbi:hypothetical protein Nmel_000709, partial [Mimus melanotis]